MLSAALLIVSGAEAMAGHCAKAGDAAPAHMMSDHCAEMMGMDMPGDPEEGGEAGSGVCCCAIISVPVLLPGPLLSARVLDHASWRSPVNSNGLSAPSKVAIPPPKM